MGRTNQCARAQVKAHVHKLACTTQEVARTVPQENPSLRTSDFRRTSAFSAAQLQVSRAQARSRRARGRFAPPEGESEPAHVWFSPHKLHLARTNRLSRCKSKLWHWRMLMLACGRRMSRARSTMARTWSEFHRGVEGMQTLSLTVVFNARRCIPLSDCIALHLHGTDTSLPHCVFDDSESFSTRKPPAFLEASRQAPRSIRPQAIRILDHPRTPILHTCASGQYANVVWSDL